MSERLPTANDMFGCQVTPKRNHQKIANVGLVLDELVKRELLFSFSDVFCDVKSNSDKNSFKNYALLFTVLFIFRLQYIRRIASLNCRLYISDLFDPFECHKQGSHEI